MAIYSEKVLGYRMNSRTTSTHEFEISCNTDNGGFFDIVDPFGNCIRLSKNDIIRVIYETMKKDAKR